MTLDDLLGLLRQHLSDEQAVGWADQSELLAFLDRAADYLSSKLITDGSAKMMKELSVDGETALPEGFVKFAGVVPVFTTGGMCRPHQGAQSPVDVLCWCKLKLPSTIGDEEQLPYDREVALLIADIARILAQNKNEFDISQDINVLGLVNSAATASLGR